MYSLFKVTPDLAVRKTDGVFTISFVTSDMSNVLLDTGDATGIKTGLSFNHNFTITPPFLINVISDFSLITDIACTGQLLTACDITRFENLEYLDISNNLIDAFEISQNTELVNLNISNNQIPNLDITNNVNLLYMDISNNLLLEDNINQILIQLDQNGLSNGTLNYSNNAEIPSGDPAFLAYSNLIDKGWIITGAKPQGISLLVQVDTTIVSVGSSDDISILLPIQTFGVGSSFLVEWGDGAFDTYNYGDGYPTHTYSIGGVKNISITASEVNFLGRFSYSSAISRDKNKILDIKQWGSRWKFERGVQAFSGCINLDITATDKVYFAGACDNMFAQCTSLTNVGDVDTSQVTSLGDMFSGATLFNQNINNWDVSNVTNINSLFLNATSFNQPLNNWNIASLTIMIQSLRNATSFDQDLSSWNITRITNMGNFLAGATLSTANYDALLVGWEAQNVKDNVTFSAGNSKYTLGSAAAAARQRLITDHNWTITDGGGI